MTREPLELARSAVVVLFLALALASTVWTYGDTWTFLADEREAYAELTAEQPNLVPEFQSLLPLEAERFFFANLRRGDRFYLHVQEGTFFTGVDLPTAVRTFGRFTLLPAVAVREPSEADVVLAIGADPDELGLRYVSVERAMSGRYTVARVRVRR